MIEIQKLREEFLLNVGINWVNSEGEPDIDYVLWLENKVINCNTNYEL